MTKSANDKSLHTHTTRELQTVAEHLLLRGPDHPVAGHLVNGIREIEQGMEYHDKIVELRAKLAMLRGEEPVAVPIRPETKAKLDALVDREEGWSFPEGLTREEKRDYLRNKNGDE